MKRTRKRLKREEYTIKWIPNSITFVPPFFFSNSWKKHLKNDDEESEMRKKFQHFKIFTLLEIHTHTTQSLVISISLYTYGGKNIFFLQHT